MERPLAPHDRAITEPFIAELMGITKTYQDVVALKDVTLQLVTGSCTALVGPNGAGKTTLLEILEGVRRPDSGRVRIFGKEYRESDRSFLSRMGVGAQSIALNPLLKVKELFQLYTVLYEKPWDPVKLMEWMNLTHKSDVRFSRLSGGEKKRVSVALALIGRPDLLILDEPTGELDPQARRCLWELIKSEGKMRMHTVLLATHQMEEAESLCDHVIIINKGEIIDSGSPDDLISKHCPQYRLKFSITSKFDKNLINGCKVEFEHEFVGEKENAQIFLPDIDEAYAVMDRMRVNGGTSITEMSLNRMTLDDVFVKLTENTSKF